jgi:type II secretory ATPase GspE/PulE/Tfp pilus assembly ATPase PilB-like protein
MSLDLDLFQKPSLSSQEIFSLIKKHQADVIVNNVYSHNINQALLDLALENKIVISSAEGSSSLEALYKLKQNHLMSDLKNNISLVICQKFISRLCPYCQERSSLNKYEKNHLKNLSFNYNWFNLEEKSRYSSGCPRCLYSGKNGEIGIFETLSLKSNNLNTLSLINDAKAKYDLGLIDVESLLSFS